MKFGNKKTVVIYGAGLALLAFIVDWLQYQHAFKALPPATYIVLIALIFSGLGIWAGKVIFANKNASEFEVNNQAISTLGLTQRELQVLQALADGQTNKQIAEGLFVSLNTVKTHIMNLYKKMDVERRTQAIQKARGLQIIP